MERGTLVEHEGRPAVRFRRRFDHPVERVWAAVTDPGELSHWFPCDVWLEPRAGGRIEFSGDPNIAPTAGIVLAYQPPSRLAFTWGASELHFELEADSPRGCVLTLTDVLEARDAAARNAAGWEVCLAELRKHLGGLEADGPHTATAESWQEHYDSYLAAGMPSGAFVPAG